MKNFESIIIPLLIPRFSLTGDDREIFPFEERRDFPTDTVKSVRKTAGRIRPFPHPLWDIIKSQQKTGLGA